MHVGLCHYVYVRDTGYWYWYWYNTCIVEPKRKKRVNFSSKTVVNHHLRSEERWVYAVAAFSLQSVLELEVHRVAAYLVAPVTHLQHQMPNPFTKRRRG